MVSGAGAAMFALCAALAGAVPPRAIVLVDAESKPYREAIAQLRADGVELETLIEKEPMVTKRLQGASAADTWIAMGPRSAGRLRELARGRRAAAFVRRDEVPAGVPAVWLEPDLATEARWLATAFPGRRRVIVLRRPGGPIDDRAITAALASAGLTLAVADVRSPGEAGPALTAALRTDARGSIVWLLPDPIAVGPDTVGALIGEALAARAPVVGFSGYFLRVGALAAVEIDYRAIGRLALTLARTATAAEDRRAPERATLVVDGRLAERLGITVGEGPGVEVRR